MRGEKGRRGSEFPTFHTLYSQLLPPSLVVPASVCIFCCEKLQNVAKFISIFSRLLPPCVSRLPPSFLPSPIDSLPLLLLGSCPPVLLHFCPCKLSLHLQQKTKYMMTLKARLHKYKAVHQSGALKTSAHTPSFVHFFV